jgi:ubiquinol-cytochrome c reductase cytochrome c1 subunit
MTRLIGIIVGLGFTLVVLIAFITGAYTAATEGMGEQTAEREFHLAPKEVAFRHEGAFGKWDLQQLQRGYQVYKEVCSACHSLKLVALRDLADLGYTEAEVKAAAAEWTVPGTDQVTGETNTRPGIPTDYFPSPYPNDIAARAANNNAIPPDLSLMAKARHEGPAYIYSLLTGYRDPSTFKHDGKTLKGEFPQFATPTGLYFNPYFPNLNIAMPPPLSDGQVTYADGTPNTQAQMSKDVSAFLSWAAEPTLVKRKQTGWAVLGFLIFFTVLTYFAKLQVWAPLKPKKVKG